MIKTEQLKKVAEYMGYDPFIYNNVCFAYASKTNKFWLYEAVVNEGKAEEAKDDTKCVYNPLENAEQCLELMEKLKISIGWSDKNEIAAFSGRHTKIAKTIGEAVTKAAIAKVLGEV